MLIRPAMDGLTSVRSMLVLTSMSLDIGMPDLGILQVLDGQLFVCRLRHDLMDLTTGMHAGGPHNNFRGPDS